MGGETQHNLNQKQDFLFFFFLNNVFIQRKLESVCGNIQ